MEENIELKELEFNELLGSANIDPSVAGYFMAWLSLIRRNKKHTGGSRVNKEWYDKRTRTIAYIDSKGAFTYGKGVWRKAEWVCDSGWRAWIWSFSTNKYWLSLYSTIILKK